MYIQTTTILTDQYLWEHIRMATGWSEDVFILALPAHERLTTKVVSMRLQIGGHTGQNPSSQGRGG